MILIPALYTLFAIALLSGLCTIVHLVCTFVTAEPTDPVTDSARFLEVVKSRGAVQMRDVA